MHRRWKTIFIHVRHKVKDYRLWKKVFDDFALVRKKGGEKSYQIFTIRNDPNDVFLIFEWDTLENFNKFSSSEDTKKAIQKAGVEEGGPDALFLDKTGSGKL